MIEITLHLVVVLEGLSQSFTVFPRNAVDNSASIFETRTQHLYQILLSILHFLLFTNFIDQVGPIERTLEIDNSIFDSKPFCHIIFNFLSCSSSQAKNWHFWESLFQNVQVEVVFAEILPPMRNTVHFVDHKAVNSPLRIQIVHNADQARTFDDLFWRQVNQLEISISNPLVHIADIFLI